MTTLGRPHVVSQRFRGGRRTGTSFTPITKMDQFFMPIYMNESRGTNTLYMSPGAPIYRNKGEITSLNDKEHKVTSSTCVFLCLRHSFSWILVSLDSCLMYWCPWTHEYIYSHEIGPLSRVDSSPCLLNPWGGGGVGGKHSIVLSNFYSVSPNLTSHERKNKFRWNYWLFPPCETGLSVVCRCSIADICILTAQSNNSVSLVVTKYADNQLLL